MKAKRRASKAETVGERGDRERIDCWQWEATRDRQKTHGEVEGVKVDSWMHGRPKKNGWSGNYHTDAFPRTWMERMARVVGGHQGHQGHECELDRVHGRQTSSIRFSKIVKLPNLFSIEFRQRSRPRTGSNDALAVCEVVV